MAGRVPNRIAGYPRCVDWSMRGGIPHRPLSFDPKALTPDELRRLL